MGESFHAGAPPPPDWLLRLKEDYFKGGEDLVAEYPVVMAHGADPGWDVPIRLMLKYKGLHLMTSAYLPRYFPDELIHFINTRGQDKIIYASDHPVLSMERCLSSARGLDLREGVLDKFLRHNAEKLFFSKRSPLGRGNETPE